VQNFNQLDSFQSSFRYLNFITNHLHALQLSKKINDPHAVGPIILIIQLNGHSSGEHKE